MPHEPPPDLPERRPRPSDGPGPRIVRRRRDEAGGLPPWYAPLTAPRWLRADEAALMRPDDPVLGIAMNGGAWALPWWVMKNHHVANLELNGKPVLVTLCEMCTSSGAFDPVIRGQRHWFRLEGIYNGTIMPTDDETGSLWTGFTGESIAGPLKDTVMPRLPLVQCTWAEWTALHPGTLVVDGEGERRDGHGEGHTPGSPLLLPGMGDLITQADRRLHHYELVLGVLVGTSARCYPLSALTRHGPALNDSLGGEDIVVFSRPDSWMAIAYSRHVDGRRLDFRAKNGAIVDEQTGSRWEMTGLASAGPLQGRQLRYVNSGIEEFFIWAAFYPGTDIHDADATLAASPRLPAGAWSADLVPEAITRAIKTWWTKGATVLHAACGGGLLSAWMAEMGMVVHAVDPDPDAIARARRSFRGVVRLEFDVADLRRPHTLPRQFDALLDYGHLASMRADERATYASNMASAARPGAQFLVLVACDAERQKRIQNGIKELFGGAFNLFGVRELPLPDPVTGETVPGVAFGLVRR